MLQKDEKLIEIESKNWNNGPLYLSQRELSIPKQVLNDFFQLYSLPEVRTLIKVIFHSSNIENFTPQQILILQNQFIKSIEAAWLLKNT